MNVTENNATASNQQRIVSIWRIPINRERLIDFKRRLNDERDIYEIFELLIKYKVLYFVNITVDYLNKFHNANRIWNREIERYSSRL